MPLHPEAAAYLKAVEDWMMAHEVPPCREMGPERTRTVLRELIADLRPSAPEMALIEDRTIPTRAMAAPA